MLDQNAFSESPQLMECLDHLDMAEDGCYRVSSLAELAGVLQKLQAEKARQSSLPEKERTERALIPDKSALFLLVRVVGVEQEKTFCRSKRMTG